MPADFERHVSIEIDHDKNVARVAHSEQGSGGTIGIGKFKCSVTVWRLTAEPEVFILDESKVDERLRR